MELDVVGMVDTWEVTGIMEEHPPGSLQATINGVRVEGDKSLEDYGIAAMTAEQITTIMEGLLNAKRN